MIIQKALILSLLLLGLVPFAGIAEEPPPPPPPEVKPPRHEQTPEQRHFDRGAAQLILRMTEEERIQIYKLQRENPAEYRKVMEQKLDLWRTERAKKREIMEQLLNSYRTATPEEQPKIKEQLAQMVAEDFRRRIEDLKVMLQDAQKRVDHLSADVEKREKNFDQTVEARVKYILENGLQGPPRRGK